MGSSGDIIMPRKTPQNQETLAEIKKRVFNAKAAQQVREMTKEPKHFDKDDFVAFITNNPAFKNLSAFEDDD